MAEIDACGSVCLIIWSLIDPVELLFVMKEECLLEVAFPFPTFISGRYVCLVIPRPRLGIVGSLRVELV